MSGMSRSSKLIFILPEGRAWTGGGCVDLAVLPMSEAQLESRFGLPLERGTEDGLGDWSAVGGRLPSGANVVLIRHAATPGPTGFTLQADAGASLESVLQEVLAMAGVARSSLEWISPRVQSAS
jgi:hypothetical protein